MADDNEAQRDRLAAFANTLLSDPELSRQARRLVRKKDPSFVAPDLDLEDALAKQDEAHKKELAELRKDIDAERLAKAQEEAERLIKSNGFEPDAIYKIVKEDRVGSIPAAIELARVRAQQTAEAEAHAVTYSDRTMRFADNFKDIQKNPLKWARTMAHKAIDEIKAQRQRA